MARTVSAGSVALRSVLAVLALGVALPAPAVTVEEVLDVPVSVKDAYGRQVDQTIKVTVFRDDSREKAPYLVLNHGRPSSPADFATMKRQRYSENSRYFVSLGFVVFVPTRVGYGESGGVDVEDSGRCDSRNFPPAYAAAADETVAVLQKAATLPFADLTRGIVVGQSFGGMTSVALSARDLPGLVAAVNFAGGGGGDPVAHPARPCSEARLKDLFRAYGARSRVPTLWLYSENDQFWGPDLPRDWFAAFVDAGGKGRFVRLPPYRQNGHGIFSGEPSAWKPAFEAFLREIGFLS